MKRSFQLMLKPIGPVCNLKCDYCYYLEKVSIYEDKMNAIFRFIMTSEVLEKFIRNYIFSQTDDEILFTWQGGEPLLLGIEFFKKAVDIQKRYADGRRIYNSIQTNGTLITEEWTDFLANNNFLVGLSIDGPADIHDHYRTYPTGKGSFSRIMKSVRLLHKYNVEFNTLTVVNNRNSKMPLKVYRFLKDIGSKFIQFIPVVEREADDPATKLKLVTNDYKEKTWLTEESVDSMDWGKFLIRIFDEWVRIDIGKYYVNYFDNTLAPYADEAPSLCTMQQVCGRCLVLEHNGDIYSCDHFVYPQYLIGNVMNDNLEGIANSEFQLKFGQDKYNTLPHQCHKCEFLKMCGGDCPKHRFIKNKEGEWISFLHDGFLYYFQHVDKFMKMMANELNKKQPPANIMSTFPEKERKRLQKRVKFRLN
jgi:uncharacterized protein